jgi:histone H3/H4
MAADATKETINDIVVESGNSVVEGIAKEVTEDTAELAAQDGELKFPSDSDLSIHCKQKLRRWRQPKMDLNLELKLQSL